MQKEPADHSYRHHGAEHERDDILGHHTRPSHRAASTGCGTRTRTDVFAPSRVSTVIVRTGRGARASPAEVTHAGEM